MIFTLTLHTGISKAGIFLLSGEVSGQILLGSIGMDRETSQEVRRWQGQRIIMGSWEE